MYHGMLVVKARSPVERNMIDSLLVELARVLGCLMILVGGIFELIGAIGVNKLRDFQTRAHASTLTVIGGGVLPLIGVALLALSEMGWSGAYITSMSLLTAVLILVTAPTGIHSLMRVALRQETPTHGQESEVTRN